MERMNASQPNVFGQPRHKYQAPKPHAGVQRTPVPTEDINQEIISSMQTIQATVQNTNTDRTAYLISGFALLIISGLAYQNSVMSQDRQIMSELIRKMAPEAPYQRPHVDSSPCLEILKPNNQGPDSYMNEFGRLYANYVHLLGQTDEQKVQYLSEVQAEIKYTLPTLQKQTQSHITRLSALLEASCPTIINEFKHLLPLFPKETLQDAFRSASKAANFGVLGSIIKALTDQGVPPIDIDYDYALSISDPVYKDDLSVTLYLQKGNGPIGSIYKLTPALDGVVHTHNNIFNSEFQKQLIQTDHFKQHYVEKFKALIAKGRDDENAQNTLDLYLAVHPDSPIEKSVYQSIANELEIAQDEDKRWVSKMYIDGEWSLAIPTQVPTT